MSSTTGEPLDRPRDVTSRVQGCCRDHTLLCVAGLRTHGVPARSRVGFAGYFIDGWHHDHVVAEAWLDARWRRFDSELEDAPAALPTPMDNGPESAGGSGFVTAVQVWTAYRRGDLDPETHGVDPAMPVLRGPRFVFEGLHPGPTVLQASPYGGAPVPVALQQG